VTQGYRPYPDSPSKQRTIKSFRYLEDQEDPVTFWAEIHAINDSLKKKRNLRIEIPVSEMMYSENNRLLNYGYKFPEFVCRLLNRILYPASKREAALRLLNYYGLTSEFDLLDIYRALDRFNNFSMNFRFISMKG